MSIIRWEPINSALRWPSIWEDEDWGLSKLGADNLDVYETKDEVVVKANVAGIDPDKVDITFEKGVLSISGQEVEEKEGKKYYKKASRSYSYRVAVPGNINPSAEPEAKVSHGIVSVTFKKAAEVKPKKIAVKK